MPRSRLDDAANEVYLLEDLKSSPGQFERGIEYDIGEVDNSSRKRTQTRSVIGQLLSPFGFSAERSEGRFGFDDAPTLGPPRESRWTRSPREIRRFRPSVVLRCLRRVVFALPVLILIFFGVLHVLEALLGRTRLLWNEKVYEHAFLGRHGQIRNLPGHVGFDAETLRVIAPIPCHSHNDYWRGQPLFDAIRWGCTGVEADVWLFDGELYVGHHKAELAENRTLRTLYIDPLVKLLDRSDRSSQASRSKPNGVFDSDPAQTLVLLIDFKGDGHDTFGVVEQQLRPLRERNLVSYWDGTRLHSRAVTVVATGNTPLDMVLDNSSYRDIFLDAPLRALWEPPREPIGHSDALHSKDGEIDYGTAMSLPEGIDANSALANVNAELFNTSTAYYASTSFASDIGFVWRGHLSPRQMNIIRGQIRGAKRRGLKARYWNTPAWPTALRNHVWHVLIKEGADVLNVDDLKAAALQDWTIPVHGQFV